MAARWNCSPKAVRPGAQPVQSAAYRCGPSGGFGHAVGIAEDIVFKLIESKGMGFDEAPVVEILGDHDMGHGYQHGCVGAGSDGNPALSQSVGRAASARIDADDGGAVFFGLRKIVGRVRSEP